MTRFNLLLAAVCIGAPVLSTTPAHAGGHSNRFWTANVCGETVYTEVVQEAPKVVETKTIVESKPTVVKQVQQTASYRIARAEVVAGGTHTVFANFLEEKPGKVDLVISGISHCCKLEEWRDQAVTITLPMLGLDSPRNGRLRITRPDGRVAKSLDVVVQPQPVVIVHQETIGQPTPAGPSDQTPTYAGDGAQD